MPAPSVPVNITGIGWNTIILALIAALNGGVLGVFIRTRPQMAKLKNEREERTDSVRTQDMNDMRERIGDLETKVETAATAAHRAEMNLVYAVSAVQLLAARIRADNPNDPTLKQAMELLSAATGGNLPSWESRLVSGIAEKTK